MSEPAQPYPSLVESRAELIKQAFGSDVWNQGDRVVEELTFDRLTVVGHVDVYLRRVIVGYSTIPVAGIGNVCVRPAYQGQGIATGLVRLAHTEAQGFEGVEFAALFAGDGRLYEKVGYWRPYPEQHPTFYVCDLYEGVEWPRGSIDIRAKW